MIFYIEFFTVLQTLVFKGAVVSNCPDPDTSGSIVSVTDSPEEVVFSYLIIVKLLVNILYIHMYLFT